MTAVLSRWLPGAALTAWSAILLHAYFAGRVIDMLHPSFRPGVLFAGLAMAVMALISLARPMDAECCATAECGHPMSRSAGGKLLTFGILVLPMIAAALFSKDAFTKQAMLNRGVLTDATTLRPPEQKAQRLAPPDLPLPTKDGSTDTQTAQTASPAPTAPVALGSQAPAAGAAAPVAADGAPVDYLQRTPEGFIVAEVLDLLYAAQDNTLRKDFEGKTVQLIGQLMPDATSNANGNRFKAVRMFMTCCAADAKPVATIVEAQSLPNLPEMTWVKITGVSTFPVENGRRMALLKAEIVEKTEPPAESMLY